MPFLTDGSPLESTPEQAAQTYDEKISPSFLSNVGTSFVQDSTIGDISRAAERGQYQQGSWFDRALVGISQANSGMEVSQPKNDPEAYQTLLLKQAQEKAQREDALQRFQGAHSWPVNAASGLAAFILDPLQASSTLVPGLGEEAVLGRLGTGFIGRTAARLTAGATAGGLSQIPVSAFKAGLSSIDDQDYTLRDAATDVFMGAAAGALFHTGIGTVGDIFNKTIAKAPAEVQHQAMSTATSQILEGRPVEVRPVIKPNYSPADLEDKETLINQRNLVQRSIETLGQDPENQSHVAELGQSLKDIDNKLYVIDLRSQEKDILDRVNGNEEELPEDRADDLSLIRQEIYRTVDEPSDLSYQQQEIYDQGYQPGVSQEQLRQTQSDISENSKIPPKDKTSDDYAKTVQDLEGTWANLEQEALPNLSKEEIDELNTSKQAVDQANQSEGGYNQASNCLTEAGV